MIRRNVLAATALLLASIPPIAQGGPSNLPSEIPFRLREPLLPSPIRDVARGSIPISGDVAPNGPDRLRIRITLPDGRRFSTQTAVRGGRFACRYPEDFPGAPPPAAGVCFLDVEPAGGDGPGAGFRAESTIILRDSASGHLPEFPSAFTCDLLDAAGRTDRNCREWPVIRSLVDLYMHSRAAALIGIGRPDFDLEREDDLRFFKNSLALYEFDHRDRDWSTPLGHRVARTFWQSVWNTWFNSSNDNPIDGNDRNRDPSNYVPYAFSNDFCDTLILYLLRRDLPEALDDNLDAICREGLRNLMAMQHRDNTNFSRPDSEGRRHVYTAGAFRYGMFENGTFMSEGNGWFYRPGRVDYLFGGVFNARSLWGIGEGLRRYPDGELGRELRRTMALGLRFCLFDALEHGYAKETPSGKTYWYDAGEMGYLLLGMLAAEEVDPDMEIAADGKRRATLHELTLDGLDALVELMKPYGQWQKYANKDPMVICALAEGAMRFPDHPRASAWKGAALKAADAWLNVKVDPSENPGPVIHFGSRRLEPDRMTFLWDWREDDPGRKFIFFYITGHWIQAYASLYDLTGNARYRERAEAMIRYLCGENPWHVRILNETGGVYNWVEDTDGDGVEDQLKQDMYPESTAFCQIGIDRFLRALNRRDGAASR